MKILLTLAFVVVLVGSAHAVCERTETSELFLKIVKTCGKASVRLTRLDMPTMDNACSGIEAKATMIELRTMAAGDPGICKKNSEMMQAAIEAFRAAINATP